MLDCQNQDKVGGSSQTEALKILSNGRNLSMTYNSKTAEHPNWVLRRLLLTVYFR